MKGSPSGLSYSHSHQQVLTRYLSEALQLFGLDILVLDSELFPSGQAYHENKKLVNKVIAKTYRPYVFHMCWTDNRVNKVVYFKDVGLWFLPDVNSCRLTDNMLEKVKSSKDDNIRDRCCQRQLYWPKLE